MWVGVGEQEVVKVLPQRVREQKLDGLDDAGQCKLRDDRGEGPAKGRRRVPWTNVGEQDWNRKYPDTTGGKESDQKKLVTSIFAK